MKKIRGIVLCGLLFSLLLAQSFMTKNQISTARATVPQQNLVQYVNPLIGTGNSNAPNPVGNGSGGNTFPGADVPFGMVQWSPDTPHAGTGYAYSDTQINGFSLTHFSGAGCANNQDVPVSPTIGANNTNTTINFSHHNESLSAGYYGVRLDNGVNTELTVTQRSGFGRFTFPATTRANLDIDASRAATGTSKAHVQTTGSRELSGQETSGNFCGTHNLYTIYFDAQFDRDFAVTKTWNGGSLLTFDTTQNPVVQMKVGVSFVSVANARANLVTENPYWNFAAVRTNARGVWNSRLNAIQVNGGSVDQMTKFYTALYHAYLHPGVFSDTNGQYIGFDGQVRTAYNYTQYANFSGWDIFRSEIPLLALLAPNETNDIVKSLIADAQQCGAFPKWAQNNSDTGVMVGDPDSISVANAYTFGATGFDTATALSFMLKSATQPGTNCGGYPIRKSLSQYLSYGYIPFDKSSEWGPASTTVEYANTDFAISQFAHALGDNTTSRQFLGRSAYWQNEFNTGNAYIQPRNLHGSWKNNFDPNANDGYVEGNAAQYIWTVPYNLHGLFSKMGGNAAVVSRLDKFFSQLNAGLNTPNFYMGNEPGFASPWVYDWAQQPSGTQRVVHTLVTQTFLNTPSGLPGNDDLGAMSSWYVWAALGMYPEIPGVAGFALSSPIFPNTILNLGNGHTVNIHAYGAPDPYIQHMSLNNYAYNSPWLPLSAITNGATLNYTLGGAASSWGSAANMAPPSFDSGTYTSVVAAFNSRGMSDDRNRTNADLDGSQFNYSHQALATQGIYADSTVNADGLTYNWPNPAYSGLDNITAVGQTLLLNSPPGATRLGFLGAATNGPAIGNGTLTYTDNSTQDFALGFSDWTLNGGSASSPTFGNTAAVSMPYRNGNLGLDHTRAYVFSASIGLNASKTLKSVTLPGILNTGALLHIFALSFGSSNNNGNSNGTSHIGTNTNTTLFSTGFENSDPQPSWINTIDTDGHPAGGVANIVGICCNLNGPEVALRSENDHSGIQALMYSGGGDSLLGSYAYLKVFDLSRQNITVGTTTTLSYWIFPQSLRTGGAPISGNNSSCVAIDLIFSDGTNLRDTNAVDQNGRRIHPAYQCNHLRLDTWNHVIVNLGVAVTGKTITRLDIGYDQPRMTGGYRGYIDDINISN